MKALLLFTKESVTNNQADPQRLTELLQQDDPSGQYSYAFFEDLLFYISNDKTFVIDTVSSRDLSSFDCIYFRYWGNVQALALACSRYCDIKKIPFIDAEVLKKGSFNKLNQYMNLYSIGVPIPNTLVASQDIMLKEYRNYFSDFPVLIKAVNGTRGSDNYVVHSHEELAEKLNANQELMFTMQNFIANEGDYRVIVMGDTIPLVILRKAKSGTHLNNTSQGGSAEVVSVDTLPKEVQAQAIKAANSYGRTVAGVDVMRSSVNGTYYFLEVNRSPQIEHSSFEAEKAKALTTYLKQLAKS